MLTRPGQRVVGRRTAKQSDEAMRPRATRRFVPMQLLRRGRCDLNRGEHKDKERRECHEPRDRNLESEGQRGRFGPCSRVGVRPLLGLC